MTHDTRGVFVATEYNGYSCPCSVDSDVNSDLDLVCSQSPGAILTLRSLFVN